MLRLAIRSAPEPRGVIEPPDLSYGIFPVWTGPAPVPEGTYVGRYNRTFVFSCTVAGTIGTTPTITVIWTESSPELNSGVLNLGTDSGYVAGDTLNVWEGLSVSFGSGTLVASQVFAIEVIARNVLPDAYREVVTDVEAGAIDLGRTSMTSRDLRATNFDERVLLEPRAILRNPSVTIDSLNDEQRRALLELEQFRQRCTFFENYGPRTRLLWRGAGMMPLVGRRPNFSRSTAKGYRDPKTDLFSQAATDVPRITGGPEITSGVAGLVFNKRHPIPDQNPPMGKSLAIGDQTINHLHRFHPARADDGTVTLGWDPFGTAAVSFTDEVRGVLDPAGGWDPKFLRGVMKVELKTPSTNAVYTTPADRFTVSAGQKYSPTVWVRGRGFINFRMRTGPATPSIIYAQVDFDIPDDGRWHQVSIQGAPAVTAGHVIGDIAIFPIGGGLDSGQDAFYVSAAAVSVANAGPTDELVATDALVATDGSIQVGLPDVFTLRDPLPPSGSLSFWMRWPTASHTKFIGILRDSTGQFILERREGSPDEWNWWTISTARVNALNVQGNPTSLNWDTWVQVGMTWYPEIYVPPTFPVDPIEYDRMRKKFYVNGELVASEVVPAADRAETAPGVLTFFPTGIAGPAGDWGHAYDGRVAEIRIDDAPMTDQDMREQYRRVAVADHAHIHREFAGRIYDVESDVGVYLSRAARDKIYAQVSLAEAGCFDDSLVTGR